MEIKFMDIWLKQPNQNYHKFFLSMKITILLLLTCVMNTIANNSYSQTARVTLNLKNAKVEEVLNEIEKKSDYYFLLNQKQVDVNRRVDVVVENSPIKDILSNIFKNQDVNFMVYDRQIIITTKESSMPVEAQQKKITGTVSDSVSGEPIVGAIVRIEGTNTGVITDINGKFSLDPPKPNSVVVISFLGYNPERIILSGQSTLNIKLVAEVTKLEELVVVGYGTQRKKDLTGSVSAVGVKDLKSLQVPSVGDAIQGRAAGVQVISSGTPGSNVSFRIRGTGSINSSNEPLIVIDGLPTDFGLNQLNMDDIESLQVLKDASAAAIYGSRGANGVVIVTTKRGIGGKSHLDINYYTGMQKVTNMMQVLNAAQFASLHNEMMANNGLPQNPAFADPKSLSVGTDWVGQLFKTAPVQNISVSYSGSNDKTNYYVSGNVFDQKGIVTKTGFKRYTVQLNTDTKIFNRVKFGNNLTITNDIKTSGSYNINNTLWALPTQPIFRNGDYSGPLGQPSWSSDIVNPIGLVNTRENSTIGYNLLGGVYGEVEILDGLKFKSNYGIQANFWNDRNWSPKYKWDNNVQANSFLGQQANKAITWVWDNTLTYDKILNKVHHITVMAGSSAQANRFDYQSGSIQSFASDNTQQLNNGILLPSVGGSANEWSLLSYMGRANYSYSDRYLVTATVRYDGSSRFGENHKTGIFPSGSVAWRVSNEKFFKGITVINDLKIRAGYGITGNQSIGNYSFASTLQTISYNFNNSIVSAVVPNVMPNPNVQWEQVEQSNIGFDMGLLKDRIMVTFDAYIKNSNRLLVPMVVPVSTGYSDVVTPSINAGKMQNKGVELTISTRNLDGNLKWSTNFNISYNHNEVISLNDSVPMPRGSIGFSYDLARLQAGHPMNAFYGFVTDGIFQTQQDVEKHAVQVPGNDPFNRTSPGDIRFKDINNDGVIDDKDRVYIGNPNPKFIFALNNTFS